jgi:hypothetical protein
MDVVTNRKGLARVINLPKFRVRSIKSYKQNNRWRLDLWYSIAEYESSDVNIWCGGSNLIYKNKSAHGWTRVPLLCELILISGRGADDYEKKYLSQC